LDCFLEENKDPNIYDGFVEIPDNRDVNDPNESDDFCLDTLQKLDVDVDVDDPNESDDFCLDTLQKLDVDVDVDGLSIRQCSVLCIL
jgi:hypothetical protein